MFLNPDRMTSSDRKRVDDWLAENGCPHHVAGEPVVVRGSVVEYTALCQRNTRAARRLRFDVDLNVIPLGRKRLRVRSPRPILEGCQS